VEVKRQRQRKFSFVASTSDLSFAYLGHSVEVHNTEEPFANAEEDSGHDEHHAQVSAVE
jgi:hypothetical protein